jgi:lipopolysaccharide transport system ATP-binding protein
VAAHLEPDVLLVDEVLAVGDAAFQKKCADKITSLVQREHRTVLLVTHNATAAINLCKKGLFLHGGRLVFFGDVHQAVRLYLSSENLWEEADRVLGRPEVRQE